MNYPVTPKPPQPGNKAITILRIFLWLIPAIILPFAIALGAAIYPLWPLVVVAGLAAFAAIGYFDQRLSLQQKHIDPSTGKRELIRWTIIFTILQLMIAPAIGCTVLYGICMVTDSGYF